MKARPMKLEFGVTCLADIRFLWKAWDRLWAAEDRSGTESILVDVFIEDRLPGEEVCLNFITLPEVMDKFLRLLEHEGLKFTCQEIIPGFLTKCRVIEERGNRW